MRSSKLTWRRGRQLCCDSSLIKVLTDMQWLNLICCCNCVLWIKIKVVLSTVRSTRYYSSA
jgi:hypothetical protein